MTGVSANAVLKVTVNTPVLGLVTALTPSPCVIPVPETVARTILKALVLLVLDVTRLRLLAWGVPVRLTLLAICVPVTVLLTNLAPVIVVLAMFALVIVPEAILEPVIPPETARGAAMLPEESTVKKD